MHRGVIRCISRSNSMNVVSDREEIVEVWSSPTVIFSKNENNFENIPEICVDI